MITPEIEQALSASVLCWLATVSSDGVPNVSPKEAFSHDGSGRVLIAHIASPQTIRNIRENPNVCVSFIDVFTQRGYKIKGTARILDVEDEANAPQWTALRSLVGETFRILAIIEVQPTEVAEIIAPSYRVVAGMTTSRMIRQSLETYRVEEYWQRAEADGDASP